MRYLGRHSAEAIIPHEHVGRHSAGGIIDESLTSNSRSNSKHRQSFTQQTHTYYYAHIIMHTDTLRSFLEKDYSGIDKFLEQVIYRIFDKTELDPINKDDLADEENNIKLAHDTGIGRMELIGKIFQ